LAVITDPLTVTVETLTTVKAEMEPLIYPNTVEMLVTVVAGAVTVTIDT
jgi:hypothetical protein